MQYTIFIGDNRWSVYIEYDETHKKFWEKLRIWNEHRYL